MVLAQHVSPALTRSWYRTSARLWREHPPLLDSIDCDIAIIGAGLTGLNAALALRHTGLSVAIIEARQPAWGASGRSGGQLIAGYGMAPDALARQPHAQTLWSLGLEALKRVQQQIKAHAIDCDYQPGHIHAASNRRQMRELTSWQQILRRQFAYFDSELLDQPTIAHAIQGAHYLGGLRDAQSGHLHPLNFTLGLADAALRAGCQIYGSSPVTAIDKLPKPMIHTPGGHIRCRHLIVACNAYVGDLLPPLAQRFLPVGSYIGATAPLTTCPIANGEAVADMHRLPAYYRLSADNRLLFGARVGLSNQPPPTLALQLQRRMGQVFPELKDSAFTQVWGGLIAVSEKRLPQLGQLTDNIWFAQAYSGQGMALSGLAGQLLAEAISGRLSRYDVLAKIRQRAIPGGRWGQALLLPVGSAWLKLLDAIR